MIQRTFCFCFAFNATAWLLLVVQEAYTGIAYLAYKDIVPLGDHGHRDDAFGGDWAAAHEAGDVVEEVLDDALGEEGGVGEGSVGARNGARKGSQFSLDGR